jgi:hypothetical protein
MRKSVAVFSAIGIIWVGYTAWPLYDVSVLVHAIETRDVDMLPGMYISTPVRKSITSQIVTAYTRRTGEPA